MHILHPYYAISKYSPNAQTDSEAASPTLPSSTPVIECTHPSASLELSGLLVPCFSSSSQIFAAYSIRETTLSCWSIAAVEYEICCSHEIASLPAYSNSVLSFAGNNCSTPSSGLCCQQCFASKGAL